MERAYNTIRKMTRKEKHDHLAVVIDELGLDLVSVEPGMLVLKGTSAKLNQFTTRTKLWLKEE